MFMVAIELDHPVHHHVHLSTPNMNSIHQKPVHEWEKYQFKLYHYDTCTLMCTLISDHMYVHVHIKFKLKKVSSCNAVCKCCSFYHCCSTSLAVWLYWGCQMFAALSVASFKISHWFAICFLSLVRLSRVFFTFSRVENKAIVVLIH